MSKQFSLWLGEEKNGVLAERLARRFGVARMIFTPAARQQITAAQRIGAVLPGEAGATGQRVLAGLRWGLIPFWTQELENSHRLFHARAETLAEKPAFRYALSARRCLIPATGFLEWMERGGQYFPVQFRPREDEFWGFAGLWDEWQGPGGLILRTCTIITTIANPLVAPLSLRMPAVLRRRRSEVAQPGVARRSGLARAAASLPDAPDERVPSRHRKRRRAGRDRRGNAARQQRNGREARGEPLPRTAPGAPRSGNGQRTGVF